VEEVMLLREEMKRVLQMLRWMQVVWEGRAVARTGIDRELASGLKAYAARQASLHRCIAAGFHVRWNRSVATAVRDVMRHDSSVHLDLLEGGLDSALNWDPVEQEIVDG
jgi:hypothetical protein